MGFDEQDQVERDMGGCVTQFTPDQLVCYVRDSMQAINGITMAVEGIKERAVFRGMQRIYGTVDAGRIVKWVFFRYEGRWNGEPIRFFSFAKGRKWWVDMMHAEMQEHRALEQRDQDRQNAPTTVETFTF